MSLQNFHVLRLSPTLLAWLLFGVLATGTLHAQGTDKASGPGMSPAAEKEQLILELLEQTGQSAEAMGLQMADAFNRIVTPAP